MLNRLKGVFESLERHDVRYVVIGGVAVILHGVPRTTFDLDILIEATPENAERLLRALEQAGFGTAAMISPDELAKTEITIFKDRVRIDVLTAAPGLVFSDAWSRRETMDFEGQKFPVLCRADLIAAKRASGRSIDLEDIRVLEAN